MKVIKKMVEWTLNIIDDTLRWIMPNEENREIPILYVFFILPMKLFYLGVPIFIAVIICIMFPWVPVIAIIYATIKTMQSIDNKK